MQKKKTYFENCICFAVVESLYFQGSEKNWSPKKSRKISKK